jgi:hypothetical protein
MLDCFHMSTSDIGIAPPSPWGLAAIGGLPDIDQE